MSNSLLSEVAEAVDDSKGAEFVPWFRDDAKLLAAVVLGASRSTQYASELIAATSALVANNKQLRGVLRKALIPATASKTGRAKVPLWNLIWIVSDLDYLYSQGLTKTAAWVKVGEIHNRSPERVRALEKRARNLGVVGFRTNPTDTTGNTC